MAYVCKNCGLPVWVTYMNGVVEFNVEVENDKLREVDKCPRCGNRLLSRDDDLKFIPPKEKSIENQHRHCQGN